LVNVGPTRNIQAEFQFGIFASARRVTNYQGMSLASILRWCKSSFARPRRSLSHNPSASPLRCAASRAIHTTGAVEPNSTTAALQLIRSQPSQYVVASFAGRKYILTPRDMLTVPHLRDVKVGDVLVLDEIHELGSREYTLRGNPVIPPNTVKVEATVVEHTKGKMEFIFKKKRRKGYRKTIQHKQPYTRIRIGDIEIPI
jgi:large subunit ribosomal protein L21